MTTERVLLDIAICKLSRNPSKTNIKRLLDHTFKVFDHLQHLYHLRAKVEKTLFDYFKNAAYREVDPSFQVTGIDTREIVVILLLTSNNNVVMMNLDNLPAAREKAIAVKIVFGTKHPSLILPISEEYNLDEYMDTEGLKTSDMRKWYYIDPKYITRQPSTNFTHYPVGMIVTAES